MDLDKLCDSCGSEDFRKLLEGLRESLTIQHFATVRRNTACPVCVLLAYVVQRSYDAEQIDDVLANSSSRCELQWEPAAGETYLRRSAISTFSQLALRLGGVQKPAIPPFDSEALRTSVHATHNYRIDVAQTRLQRGPARRTEWRADAGKCRWSDDPNISTRRLVDTV